MDAQKPQSEVTDAVHEDDLGGWVEVEVIRDGKHGPEVIARRRSHNLIVNMGKRQTWRMTMGLNANEFTKFRIGTCGVAPVSSDTNVISPVGGIGSLTSANGAPAKTLLAGTRTAQMIVVYPSGGALTAISAMNIQEVAVLDSLVSPGGSAFMRSTFVAVNKTLQDRLQIRYSWRIS